MEGSDNDSEVFAPAMAEDTKPKSNSRGGGKPAPDYKLSVTSAKYDRGGKGYLDETEKQLRSLDTDNKGMLDLDQVYSIMQNLQGQQKKAASLRNMVYALTAFALILALANVGTSFAAARLAKDTSINSGTMSLTDKKTGERLGTTSRDVIGHDFVITADAGRRLATVSISRESAVSIHAHFCQGYTFGSDPMASCNDGVNGFRNEIICNKEHKLGKETAKILNIETDVGSGVFIDYTIFEYNAHRGNDFSYGKVTISCPHDNAIAAGSSTSTACTVSGVMCGEYCACNGAEWMCDTGEDCNFCDNGQNKCLPANAAPACAVCTLAPAPVEPAEDCCASMDVSKCCPSTPPPTGSNELQTVECSEAMAYKPDQSQCFKQFNKDANKILADFLKADGTEGQDGVKELYRVQFQPPLLAGWFVQKTDDTQQGFLIARENITMTSTGAFPQCIVTAAGVESDGRYRGRYEWDPAANTIALTIDDEFYVEEMKTYVGKFMPASNLLFPGQFFPAPIKQIAYYASPQVFPAGTFSGVIELISEHALYGSAKREGFFYSKNWFQELEGGVGRGQIAFPNFSDLTVFNPNAPLETGFKISYIISLKTCKDLGPLM